MARGHLAEQLEGLARVGVHTGRTDGELQHPVGADPARSALARYRQQRIDDRLRRGCRGLRVVMGSPPHEGDASAERARSAARGPGDVDAVCGRRGSPVQVVIGDRRDAAQQPLGYADACRDRRELRVYADAGICRSHGRQPGRHRHAPGPRQGAEGALQQVVVGVHETGGDHAAGDVEDGRPCQAGGTRSPARGIRAGRRDEAAVEQDVAPRLGRAIDEDGLGTCQHEHLLILT